MNNYEENLKYCSQEFLQELIEKTQQEILRLELEILELKKEQLLISSAKSK